MVNKLEELHALGQSIWYDNIERRLLKNGMFKQMINRGDIRGVTSNPSIFNKAIAKSDEYNDELIILARKGLEKEEIYQQLSIKDIQTSADLFYPLYNETNYGDGYVSLEVNPYLAYDTEKTLKDAVYLWTHVNRPNLMVKIPATKEGLPAITQAIMQGININVTLIFSLERYKEVVEAYLMGIEKRLANGLRVDNIASVASFFVSRIDTNVDNRLNTLIETGKRDSASVKKLQGKLAIASAKLAYQEFKEIFGSKRFKALESKGANLQRPLWASTSTKNPAYPDTTYVDNLIGPNTVNTVPPKTLQAFKDHGKVELTLENGVDEARQAFVDIEALGISMDEVTQELEDQGVKAFADAFTNLLNSIEERRKETLKMS
ncbi:MAG TPA: transaldolase [Anaerolineae bacterium]|nr:transaldolase [Anaerolineae bacterium]